ncbi:adenosylcobinamide-GDP ribazoletransferase [Bacillus thermotolerans]|uniref:Adenosylcobinamide-GDP ribazoletransferase n=1 Tax=Bacillus thermotolerans TaxID=1221996 RepID=A0A0F5I3X9_BACTR|nr:adenosylcobinamide-GDP ribazoletransferase [Bacillus thermotolerans]KKB36026.1 Cobalamin synthase [Bacillus thermotolerans]KKB40153.1 Cobalamin synthase [Bacillus thermotolerans]
MKANIYVKSLLICFQFFSVVPIRRNLPMDTRHLQVMLRLFPLYGLLKGFLYGGVFWLVLEWSPLTPLGNAFFLWLVPIIWTGGLHLDGWIDASDAFFSYRDRDRRLDILKDSRVGAFGVLSLIILLAARFLFVYEIAAFGSSMLALFVILIPFYSQLLIGLLLNHVPPARKEGLAFFFQKGKQASLPVSYTLWLALAGLCLAFSAGFPVLFLLMGIAAGGFYILARKVIQKSFGGITGDLLGASLEGVETVLWMILWLLVSIGMA